MQYVLPAVYSYSTVTIRVFFLPFSCGNLQGELLGPNYAQMCVFKREGPGYFLSFK